MDMPILRHGVHQQLEDVVHVGLSNTSRTLDSERVTQRVRVHDAAVYVPIDWSNDFSVTGRNYTSNARLIFSVLKCALKSSTLKMTTLARKESASYARRPRKVFPSQ